MTYDSDLRGFRRAAVFVLVVNLINAATQLYYHAWLNAIVALNLAYVARVWLKVSRAQQTTRDMGRIVESGLQGMQRRLDQEHNRRPRYDT